MTQTFSAYCQIESQKRQKARERDQQKDKNTHSGNSACSPLSDDMFDNDDENFLGENEDIENTERGYEREGDGGDGGDRRGKNRGERNRSTSPSVQSDDDMLTGRKEGGNARHTGDDGTSENEGSVASTVLTGAPPFHRERDDRLTADKKEGERRTRGEGGVTVTVTGSSYKRPVVQIGTRSTDATNGQRFSSSMGDPESVDPLNMLCTILLTGTVPLKQDVLNKMALAYSESLSNRDNVNSRGLVSLGLEEKSRESDMYNGYIDFRLGADGFTGADGDKDTGHAWRGSGHTAASKYVGKHALEDEIIWCNGRCDGRANSAGCTLICLSEWERKLQIAGHQLNVKQVIIVYLLYELSTNSVVKQIAVLEKVPTEYYLCINSVISHTLENTTKQIHLKLILTQYQFYSILVLSS